MLSKSSNGQSVIEVIIAVAIFIIIEGSAVVTVLGSFLTSRQGEEETNATFLAIEGLDAVTSIRNQSWDNLTDGDHGLNSTLGVWSFSGTSDPPVGKYTRKITVGSVERDASGDIVSGGGTVDVDTKKVSSQVSWNFVPSKLTLVELTSYYTNWQEVKITPSPALTPTSTPTPTPTPTFNSCNAVCLGSGYSVGTCRKNPSQCNSNGEVYQSGGDQFCTGGPNADTCCCRP